MNQVGAVSKEHNTAEDENYMDGVFENYGTDQMDKRGNPTGSKLLKKRDAVEASHDIIMAWNKLSETNTKKYLEAKFDTAWAKFDVNGKNYIDVSEATSFERSLMGSFSLSLD